MYLACEQIDLDKPTSSSRRVPQELSAAVSRRSAVMAECGAGAGPVDSDDAVVTFADLTISPLTGEATLILIDEKMDGGGPGVPASGVV